MGEIMIRRSIIPVSIAARAALTALFVVVLLTVSMAFNGGPANAASSPSPTVVKSTVSPLAAPPSVTPAQIAAAYAEIKASTVPRTTSVVGGITTEIFTLSNGTKLEFTAPAVGGIHPNLSVGSNSHGLYIELNRVDQGAIATGGAAAVGIAICAIPAVGWVLCAVVAAILAIAAFYIASYGVCPSSKPNLRVFADQNVTPYCTKY
jgi:hypothetical protein